MFYCLPSSFNFHHPLVSLECLISLDSPVSSLSLDRGVIGDRGDREAKGDREVVGDKGDREVMGDRVV